MKKKKSFFIFILITIGLTILTLTAFYVFASGNRTRITRQNREYLVDNVTQLAKNVEATLQSGYDNVKLMSLMLSQSLKGPEVDVTRLQQMTGDSIFDFMEFADPEGMDHNITGGISDAHDREYYQRGMAGETGMELIYTSRATHETLLMFYSPVYYNEEIVGSLVGVYQAANRLTKLLNVKYFNSEALTYLCSPTGRVIAAGTHIDPTTVLNITDIEGVDETLEGRMKATLSERTALTFSLPGNETGGYMVPLNFQGWYLLQIFPSVANENMIMSANNLGVNLVAFLFVIYTVMLIGMFRFFRAQQARVQAATEAKTTFLFNMSHDIRTPMNAILGYTALAKKYADNTVQVDDYLNKIDISGKQLLSLVNQVLDMSRIESGKVILEDNPIDIVERANSMLTIMEATAVEKGITLTGNIDNVSDRYVIADSSRLSQIIINILGNAVKYTREGGQVTFSLVEKSHSLNHPGEHMHNLPEGLSLSKPQYATYTFTVNDTGIGMSEEFIDHIFDPFTRERSSTISGIEGTGLGMAIVKRLADIMGGTLDISSEPGIGTAVAFTVTLRLQSDPTESPIVNKPMQHYNLIGKRVLLVEDIEMNREIACDILSEHDLRVDIAEDGDIAVEKVREAPKDFYDFILMDIQMPRMNGYDATRAIRSLPDGHGASVPIIAMTANAFEEDRQNALSAGMNAHLTKPVDIKKLLSTLDEMNNP